MVEGHFHKQEATNSSSNHGGEAFTLETLPFEALEQICAYKPSPDTSAIVGDHNVDEYNAHRLAFINALPDEKSTTADLLRNFD